MQMSYDDPYSMIDLVKSARCIINVAGPYMLTQGELMIDCCISMGVSSWSASLSSLVIYLCFLGSSPPIRCSLVPYRILGPEVALPGKRDRNRTSNEINAHDVPHFLFVKAWIRLNEICQSFEDS